MQDDPRYDDVVAEVKAFLEERLGVGGRGGRRRGADLLDPGIGFGKTLEHNLELLRRLDEIVALGRPVVVGTSRKSLPRPHHRPRRRRAPGRDDRHERARARARRLGLPRPRRRAGRGCAARWRLLRSAADERRRRRVRGRRARRAGRGGRRARSEPLVTIEITGLSLYTHHGVTEAEREVGQRLVLDLRFERRRLRRDGHRPRRGHRRLRRGLPARRARRPAALVQDARAALHGDRRPPARPLRAESVWVKAAKPEPPIPLPVRGGLRRGRARRRDERRDAVPCRARRARRLPRARLERRRPARAARRRGRRAAARHGVRVLAASSARTRPSRWARSSTSRTSSTPACGSPPRRARGAARRMQGGRARARPRGGRPRATAPRPIDVDVLLLGDARARLGAPARCRTRRSLSRRFVLLPLLELDPELAIARRDAPRRRARGARPGGAGAARRAAAALGEPAGCAGGHVARRTPGTAAAPARAHGARPPSAGAASPNVLSRRRLGAICRSAAFGCSPPITPSAIQASTRSS